MYEEIDGFSACPDLIPVRCANLRSVFGTSTCASVPLLGPYVAQLKPHVPQLGPSRPILGPKRRPRSLPDCVWSNFGPRRATLEALKHRKMLGFFAVFHVAPQKSSRTSKSAPERSQNDPQETPRSGPGRPRRGSRGFKTAPRAARSAPRAPQEPSKRRKKEQRGSPLSFPLSGNARPVP